MAAASIRAPCIQAVEVDYLRQHTASCTKQGDSEPPDGDTQANLKHQAAVQCSLPVPKLSVVTAKTALVWTTPRLHESRSQVCYTYHYMGGAAVYACVNTAQVITSTIMERRSIYSDTYCQLYKYYACTSTDIRNAEILLGLRCSCYAVLPQVPPTILLIV